MAASLGRDLIFLIMQFLEEEKIQETLHTYLFCNLSSLPFYPLINWFLPEITLWTNIWLIFLVKSLEHESGLFFNFKYFEEQVLSGNWDEAERYLLGFTKFDDNKFSMKVFFEIRKQKYLEALDKWVMVSEFRHFDGFSSIFILLNMQLNYLLYLINEIFISAQSRELLGLIAPRPWIS